MKKNIFFLLSLFSTIFCMDDDYAKKYPAPPYLTSILDYLTNNGQKSFYDIPGEYTGSAYRLNGFPNYFIKPQLDRLQGAQIMRTSIAKDNLALLDVATKYAYRNYVIAEKVDDTSESFTLEHIKQLCVLVNSTGHGDLHKWNIAHSPDGKAVVLDTKITRFKHDIDNIISGYMALAELSMTPQAKEYLNRKIDLEFKKKFKSKY